jgi:hypothetical protein
VVVVVVVVVVVGGGPFLAAYIAPSACRAASLDFVCQAEGRASRKQRYWSRTG